MSDPKEERIVNIGTLTEFETAHDSAREEANAFDDAVESVQQKACQTISLQNIREHATPGDFINSLVELTNTLCEFKTDTNAEPGADRTYLSSMLRSAILDDAEPIKSLLATGKGIPRELARKAIRLAGLMAAIMGRTRVIPELLKTDPDIFEPLELGLLALEVASIQGRALTVRTILEHFAQGEIWPQCRNALSSASFMGHIEVVKVFLEFFRAPDTIGEIVSMARPPASFAKHEDILMLLSEHSASGDVDAPERQNDLTEYKEPENKPMRIGKETKNDR